MPVAKYSFNDGTPRDEVGNNNAKAVGASLVNDRFENPRSAYYFHGTYGSYLNLGTSSVLKPSAGTISLWMNMEFKVLSGKGGEFNPIILTKSHKGDDFFEGYAIGYNLIAKRISAATTLSEEYQVNIRATDTTCLNKWYHVAITYDDKFLTLYIDGVLQNKLAKNFKSQFLEGDSVIIANTANNKNQRFFNGSIDDISIYNKVLTAEEIKKLYEAPDPHKGKWPAHLLIYILTGALFVLLVVLFFTRKSKMALEKENANNALLYKTYEQEIKTLKAQMDPHFIFNALNSIQKFIIVNDNENAQVYLTKFARLLRKMLESNEQENISLGDEIDLLNKYIEIESLRFNSDFIPVISLGKGIDPMNIFIPHMLIQPLVENAIWHGLISKKGEKKLLLHFELIDENTLSCKIEDNGVGRKHEKDKNEFQFRPLALNFIKQRLELMSKIYNKYYSLNIIDNKENENNVGTTAIITLPITKQNV